MTAIKTKIRIMHKDGADIVYTSDLDELKNFGLKGEEGWGFTYINVGTVLNFPDGSHAKVTRILTEFYGKENEVPKAGINIYGVGAQYPYNFLITYIVDNA